MPTVASAPPTIDAEAALQRWRPSSGEGTSAPPSAPVEDAEPKRRMGRNGLAGLLLAAALLGGGGYWYATRYVESTDDAQVDADVVAVPTRVSGVVQKIHFLENQRVRAGDLLAELDADQARAKLAQAEASLAAAEAAAEAADADAEVGNTEAVENRAIAQANVQTSTADARSAKAAIAQGEANIAAARARLAQAQLDADRADKLAATGAYTKARSDEAHTSLEVAERELAAQRASLDSLVASQQRSASQIAQARARLNISAHVDTLVRQQRARAMNAHAQVETARAARDLAALELSYTRILSPHDGVVSKQTIQEGQAVTQGQSVVQLVPDGRWITANFKETQLEHMHVGQPVTIHVDAYPDADLHGEVESFSGATGSRFTLLPPDNASGNFTKVVQRVPVRIALAKHDDALALRPGMSVVADVDTQPES